MWSISKSAPAARTRVSTTRTTTSPCAVSTAAGASPTKTDNRTDPWRGDAPNRGSTMSFMQALRTRWTQANSLVCVGLDPEPAKFPVQFANDPDAVFNFCRSIVDATAEYACSFKPQIAHFAALGAEDALTR